MALTLAPTTGWNTFLSVEDADAYWLGSTLGASWATASQADKERALRIATNYVWARGLLQSAWYPDMNPQLASAVAEAALRVIQGKIGRDPDATPITEKTVGPITLKYSDVGSSPAEPRFKVIDDMLHGLTTGGPPYGPVFIERV